MVLPGILKFFAKGANRNELLCLPVLLDSLHVLMNKYLALRHLVASLLVLLRSLLASVSPLPSQPSLDLLDYMPGMLMTILHNLQQAAATATGC